jgi:hypothetical protein
LDSSRIIIFVFIVLPLFFGKTCKLGSQPMPPVLT